MQIGEAWIRNIMVYHHFGIVVKGGEKYMIEGKKRKGEEKYVIDSLLC